MSCCIAVFPELEASRDKIHSIITEGQMLTSSVVAAAGHHTNHVPQAHKSRLVTACSAGADTIVYDRGLLLLAGLV